ncbi:MAG: prepilin peptidase [Paracoccaceae bacterium]|nr:prepilin peptidase [Paracoccaceae bacterium]
MSLFLPFVLPIAFWVAWSDMARMKIPNKAVLALLGVYVAVGPLVLPFETYLWHYLHFAVVLLAGFVITSLGLAGAGDSKFAAAMAPFILIQDLPNFLYLLAAVTIAAFVTHRGFRRIPAVAEALPTWESFHRKDFPMGLALSGALVLYLALPAFN